MLLEASLLVGLGAAVYAGVTKIGQRLGSREKTLRLYDRDGHRVAEFQIDPKMTYVQKQEVIDKALHQVAH